MRVPSITPLALGLVLLAPWPAARGQESALAADVRRAAESITAEQLRTTLTFIAADELEGRDTPSRGLDTAAKFLAYNLARCGLKPAGDDGTFFQRIALRRTRMDPAASSLTIGSRSYRGGADFLIARQGFFDRSGAGSGEGSVVYVPSAWFIKARMMDPLASVDLTDKILLTSAELPRGVNFGELRGRRGEDWSDPVTYAQSKGARGVLWIPGFNTLAGWTRAAEAAQAERTVVERFVAADAPSLPAVSLSPSMLQELLRGEKVTAQQAFERAVSGGAGDAVPLTAEKTVKLTVTSKSEPAATQNVVAVLEGRDPALREEYVALGAHYDHIGMRPNQPGDKIYNGADDDGSGTTALLAIAEAYARGQRPKRSLLFVWHAGEEQGLWGSRYFTGNPTVPLDRVVAQLNIDMIGRSKKEGDTNPRNRELSGPDQVYVIGSRMMSTELGSLSERVNDSYLKLKFDYRYDDPMDPNRFFYRSDHIEYARKGIPIIFYFDGVHEDYHGPSDTADRIDYDKMLKVTRTICATAGALGNLPVRPRVDKQLPDTVQRR